MTIPGQNSGAARIATPTPASGGAPPPRLHLVGLKNAGKTTLMVELVEEFTRRGLLVGTIKHSPHAHTLDQPDTDSFRHRLAGGRPSAFVTSEGTALFLPPSSNPDPYVELRAHYAGCDLILVEGDLETSAPRFEVWRSGLGRPPLALAHPGIVAVISDDFVSPGVERWLRTPIQGLADRLLRYAPVHERADAADFRVA